MNEALKPAPSAVVTAGKAKFGNALPLALIAGPCALESRAHALETAEALKEIAGRLKIVNILRLTIDVCPASDRIPVDRQRLAFQPDGPVMCP